MSSSALFFDEGSRGGYLLVKYLKQGQQGEAMIVRSVHDGKIYVRKRMTKLISQDVLVQDDQGGDVVREVHALEALDPLATMNFYPRIIDYTLSADASDCSVVYDFCNGGDLGDLITQHEEQRRPVPEPVVWYILSSVAKALAHIHFGWRLDSSMPPNWQPVVHGDVNASNIFLHYPSPSAPLPTVLLGDFGMAERTGPYGIHREQMQTDTEGIALFLPYLLTCHHRKQDERFTQWYEVAQPHYSEELLHWAFKLLSFRDDARLDTVQLMRELVPVADRRFQEAVDADVNIDIRWTKPASVTDPLSVPEYGLGPIESLIEPYKWVDLDPRSSRIIRELPGQQETTRLADIGSEYA